MVAPDAKSLSKLMLQGRQRTTIVCGMTIVPVDSSIDPKIERPVPSTGTKFTIKIARPPMCGQ
jgi:hypothetical protein